MVDTCLIFVFGTLKRGFPNFDRNDGEFMADDFVTVEKYPLYLVGERHTPWLMDDPGKEISGEIFRVGVDALVALDQFERVGEADGYRRKRVLVVDKNEMELAVEIYLKPIEQLGNTAIKAGPVGQYSSAQAALYRQRLERLH